MQTDGRIVMTKGLVKKFRKKYAAAVAAGDDVFLWAGREVLTAYAAYVLMYLGNAAENKQDLTRKREENKKHEI